MLRTLPESPEPDVESPMTPSFPRFGRLRQGAPETAAPADHLLLDTEGALPIDSAKTFVGPNGTYYDEQWRWMDWRGRSRSWNWPAALTFGGWLAYRRLYAIAALYLGWLGLMFGLALDGVPLPLEALGVLVAAVGLGAYGNTLYLWHFKRSAWAVAQERSEHEARLAALARVGGTDWPAVVAMAVGGLAMAGLIVSIVRATAGEIELSY
ncbi:MAG: hypothetical protein ACREH6_05340 [Geminicoccaceae bacterium]